MDWIAQLPLAVAPPAEGQEVNPFLGFLPFILIFVIFYFLLIAPARKKQKQHQAMLGQIKNGDKVVTNGGIHGTVVGVADDIVQLRIAEQVKIDVAKNAIAGVRERQD